MNATLIAEAATNQNTENVYVQTAPTAQMRAFAAKVKLNKLNHAMTNLAALKDLGVTGANAMLNAKNLAYKLGAETAFVKEKENAQNL